MRRTRDILEKSAQQNENHQSAHNNHLKLILDTGVRQESALLNVLHRIDQTATRDAESTRALVQALDTCRHSFEDVGSKLRFQLGLDSDLRQGK
jgi:hypothetical protein